MSRRRLLRALFLGTVALLFVASLLAIVVTGPVVVQPPRLDVRFDASPERLRGTVSMLCEELAPRDTDHVENLDRTAAWIAERFREYGLEVRTQDYVRPQGTFHNVVALRPGVDPEAGVVVVGAHYDAVPESPGADDNASGVAVLLELARTLPRVPSRCNLYLVAFGTEEPPFFATDGMGSFAFARSLQENGERVELMIALDLVGYFSDEPGSQAFPFPGLGWLYPQAGNFLAVVGDLHAGPWIKRVKLGMMSTEALPVHSFRAPARVAGVQFSDHLSFRRLGMPGVLVTDTAFMRYPDYHGRGDTPDKLDYERMAGVVRALHGVLWDPVEPPAPSGSPSG